MKFLRSVMLLLGRLMLSAVFIMAAGGKISSLASSTQFMASQGLRPSFVLLILALLIEVIGALSLILGYKTRYGALLLFLFMMPTTLTFHDFWENEAVEQHIQTLMFFKNVAIMGGLLYAITDGTGGFSLDEWFRRRQERIHRS